MFDSKNNFFDGLGNLNDLPMGNFTPTQSGGLLQTTDPLLWQEPVVMLSAGSVGHGSSLPGNGDFPQPPPTRPGVKPIDAVDPVTPPPKPDEPSPHHGNHQPDPDEPSPHHGNHQPDPDEPPPHHGNHQPDPVTPPTEPVVPAPEPITPPTEPVVPAPEPITPPTEPVVPAPEPITPPPAPVILPTEPIVPAPDPVTPPTEPVVPAPEPITPPPAPVTPPTESVVPAPEPITPDQPINNEGNIANNEQITPSINIGNHTSGTGIKPAELVTPPAPAPVAENNIVTAGKQLTEEFFSGKYEQSHLPVDIQYIQKEFSPSPESIAKRKRENELWGRNMVADGYAGAYLPANTIRSNTSIVIQRSVGDKGFVGYGKEKYYKSELEIQCCGITMLRIPVQSTADHPNLNNGDPSMEGMTLPAGEYSGYLLEKSGGFKNPIHIINKDKGILITDNYLVHPNKYTLKPDKFYGQNPYSLGCQIPKIDGFDQIKPLLESLGFEYKGDLNAYPRKVENYGSKIKIIIKNPISINPKTASTAVRIRSIL